MKLKFLKMVFAGLILSVSGLANAGLIQADFLGTNDGFYDTETGLYWVDLDQFSEGTYAEMVAQADLMGATIANNTLVRELFDNVITNDDVAALFAFGGPLAQNIIHGFYDNEIDGGPEGRAWVKGNSATRILTSSTNATYIDGHGTMGAWATYDVPEPSTLAIFALGMIGLASRRFKKQS